MRMVESAMIFLRLCEVSVGEPSLVLEVDRKNGENRELALIDACRTL